MKKTTEIVGVAELKAQLSEFLRLVKGGRQLTITERGRPIATIAPITGPLAVGGRTEELIARGAARGARRPLDADVLREHRPRDPTGRSLEVLLEERAEDR